MFGCFPIFSLVSRLCAQPVERRGSGYLCWATTTPPQPARALPVMRIVPFHFCFCFSILLSAFVTSAGQRQPLLNQPDMRIVPFHFCFCFSIFLSAFVTLSLQPTRILSPGILGLSTFVFRLEKNCLFVSNQEQWALHVTSLAKCSSTVPLCSCGPD